MDGDGRETYYSPGQIKLLLWRYSTLLAFNKATVVGHEPTLNQIKRPVRDIGEGGFEDGVALKADLDAALSSLDPVVRRIVWDGFVLDMAAVEITRSLAGSNRWFVDRARGRGLRQMALFLHWRPSKKSLARLRTLDEVLQDSDALSHAGLLERQRMIVARALQTCPIKGVPYMRCPVIDCLGGFSGEGWHTLWLESESEAA